MQLRIVLTQKCNMECTFCTNEHTYSELENHDEWPFKWFKTLISVVSNIDNYLTSITITGGEPLLHQKFVKITNSLNLLSIPITLVTNGTLISNYIQCLDCFDRINISLHSLNPVAYSRITMANKRYLSDVICSLKNLHEEYPDKVIRINTVPCEYNQESVFGLLEFANSLGCELNIIHEGVPYDMKGQRHPFPLWNITKYGAAFIKSTPHRDYYKYFDQNVYLSYTSLDKPVNRSLWISPSGILYRDVTHKETPVFLDNSFESNDFSAIVGKIINMINMD